MAIAIARCSQAEIGRWKKMALRAISVAISGSQSAKFEQDNTG